MILKFTPEVDVTVDLYNSSVSNVALSEISSRMKIDYEVWLDHNESRLKGITVVVPTQKLSFKQYINGEEYQVDVLVSDCDSEGETESTPLVDIDPFELELSFSEFTVFEEEKTIVAKAQGTLYFG